MMHGEVLGAGGGGVVNTRSSGLIITEYGDILQQICFL